MQRVLSATDKRKCRLLRRPTGGKARLASSWLAAALVLAACSSSNSSGNTRPSDPADDTTDSSDRPRDDRMALDASANPTADASQGVSSGPGTTGGRGGRGGSSGSGGSRPQSESGSGGSREPSDAGTADAGQSAAWQWFRLNSSWGPCPTAGGCTEARTVAPDGNVTKVTTETTTTPLARADRMTLFAALEDADFRRAMAQGFDCPEPPTDIWYTFTLKTAAGEVSQPVTGCVVGGQASTAKTVYELLNRY